MGARSESYFAILTPNWENEKSIGVDERDRAGNRVRHFFPKSKSKLIGTRWHVSEWLILKKGAQGIVLSDHAPVIVETPVSEPDSVGNVAALVALFDRAAAHLKFPKVRLQVGEQKVVLSRCGPRSQYTGAINVTDGERFGENVFFGRIDSDSGEWGTTRKVTDEVRDLVIEFAADPAKVAARHGHLTGSCCFCGQGLTDARSTSVGYGPVCAQRYELPWGGKPDPQAPFQNLNGASSVPAPQPDLVEEARQATTDAAELLRILRLGGATDEYAVEQATLVHGEGAVTEAIELLGA